MQLGKLEDFWETEDLVAEDVGRKVHTRLGLFGEGSLLQMSQCQNPGCPKKCINRMMVELWRTAHSSVVGSSDLEPFVPGECFFGRFVLLTRLDSVRPGHVHGKI